MSTFVEYKLDDDTTILIETQEEGGMKKASIGGNKIVKAQMKFSEALKGVKMQAKSLLKEIEDLHVNEAEIKFGITTSGELGNMAIGKIGVDVNYEITLKWKGSEAK
jgi:hypothetical protein